MTKSVVLIIVIGASLDTITADVFVAVNKFVTFFASRLRALRSYRNELRILTAEQDQPQNGHFIRFSKPQTSNCPTFPVSSGDGLELPHSAP